MRAAAIALLILSCGAPAPMPTFGDGAEQIAEPFCEKLLEHGARTEPVADCVANELDHLCVRWDCDRALTRDERQAFDKCEVDLRAWNCWLLLPTSCYVVLDLR